jgi:hypothetical protein
MNYYCDIGFWRASDQAAVAQHLKDRHHAIREADVTPHPGLVGPALRYLLRVAGLAERPAEAGRSMSARRGRTAPARTTRRSSNTGSRYWMRVGGRCGAPSAGTWTGWSGSPTKPDPSCWGWQGGDHRCG